MSKVLYEVSYQTDITLLLPVLALVLCVYFFKKEKRRAAEYDGGSSNSIWTLQFRVWLLRLGAIAAAVVIVVSGLAELDMYRNVVLAYEEGNYETVEGYVENFVPLSYENPNRESFDLNGVSFVYSDETPVQGYHIPKVYGGVVTGEGQNLRIGYIPSYRTWGNVIVYIEQIGEDLVTE